MVKKIMVQSPYTYSGDMEIVTINGDVLALRRGGLFDKAEASKITEDRGYFITVFPNIVLSRDFLENPMDARAGRWVVHTVQEIEGSNLLSTRHFVLPTRREAEKAIRDFTFGVKVTREKDLERHRAREAKRAELERIYGLK